MKDITIGIATPLSGLAGELGAEMKQAIELAIGEKNDQGGIAGMEIKAVTVDDGSNVSKAGAAARELSGEESIVGIIGHYGSDTSLAAARIYNENGLPLIAPIASNPLLTGSGLPNVFRYTNRDDQTARVISRHLYEDLHKRKAIVFKTHTAYGNSMAGEFEKAFTGYGGAVLDTISVNEGGKDFRSLVTSLSREGDVFFYGGTFEGAYLLRALRAAGFMQLMATGDGCWDQRNFLDVAGAAAEAGEGVLVLSASSAIGDIQGSSAFAEKYSKRYGPVVNYALNAYDAARMLLNAIEVAAGEGSPTKEAVTLAIRKIRFTGIANPHPVVWTDKGDNAGAITRLYVVKNGEFKASI